MKRVFSTYFLGVSLLVFPLLSTNSKVSEPGGEETDSEATSEHSCSSESQKTKHKKSWMRRKLKKRSKASRVSSESTLSTESDEQKEPVVTDEIDEEALLTSEESKILLREKIKFTPGEERRHKPKGVRSLPVAKGTPPPERARRRYSCPDRTSNKKFQRRNALANISNPFDKGEQAPEL